MNKAGEKRSEYCCHINESKSNQKKHRANIVTRIAGAKGGRISRRGPAKNNLFRRGNEDENDG